VATLFILPHGRESRSRAPPGSQLPRKRIEDRRLDVQSASFREQRSESIMHASRSASRAFAPTSDDVGSQMVFERMVCTGRTAFEDGQCAAGRRERMQAVRRPAQHPCHGSGVCREEKCSMADNGGAASFPFVQIATQILQDRKRLSRSRSPHARRASDGMLLAPSRWQRGQPPAKRFPSRARAGPNAGPAAPPAPLTGAVVRICPKALRFCRTLSYMAA